MYSSVRTGECVIFNLQYMASMATGFVIVLTRTHTDTHRHTHTDTDSSDTWQTVGEYTAWVVMTVVTHFPSLKWCSACLTRIRSKLAWLPYKHKVIIINGLTTR